MARSDGHPHPRIVGRYVLYGELASGGMATVHFGKLSGPVGFSRTVAIKRLHPQYARDPDFVSMFLDEARLCGRIRHPNVVPTLDVVTTDGEIFIVMEYVAGEALSKLLKTAAQRNIPIPSRVAATIISSVLHGLHAAHQMKDENGQELAIVHRDVSPQNILVGVDGTSRVLDFGVAKAAGRIQTTRAGEVKGKVAYMPPEQLNGELVTRQSDIYAAAVCLWEALAGRRLFDGDNEAVVLVRVLEGKVPPPSKHNPALDIATDNVVLRGLARDPSERFKTAREMALAIEMSIGLASPSEVSEWVESLAANEIESRARLIAAIESAPLGGEEPRISVLATPAEPPHSQVSSISVSRAALASVQSPKRARLGRILAIAAGVAALGVTLLGLTMNERWGGIAHAGAPKIAAHETRGHEIVKPTTGARKDVSSSLVTSSVADTPKAAVRSPVVPPPAPVVTRAPKPNPCEPPFTIDPATGHKKYKLECLK